MAQQKGKSGKPTTNGAAPAASAEQARLPAYFLSLSLENVRCFGPKQTLDLSDGKGKPAPWTIILGLNGSGKTTLLQSLASFGLVKIEKVSNGGLDWPMFVAQSHSEVFTRNEEIPTRISAGGVTSSSREEGPLGSFEMLLQRGGGVGDGLTYRFDLSTAYIWCFGYGAGRRLGSTSLSESEPDDPVATLFSDRAELRNPEEWLLQLDYAAAKAPTDKDANRRLAQARELLLSILPDIEDIRFITVRGPQPRPRVEFLTPYGWVPLRQLGYGYQTLITWVADLANRMAERYPNSPNPLAEPAVVLVDEIDLHLHPKWQRKLMSFLTERFPNTQFIATAHSPLVAQAAADANLAVLRREGDHVVIDNDVDNIRNWRVDQILTSDLFGLETARPPQIEAMLVERGKLLEKRKLTAADKHRLDELEAIVGELPFGETAQERKERAAITQALDALTKERKSAP